jgi:hypothetical protein
MTFKFEYNLNLKLKLIYSSIKQGHFYKNNMNKFILLIAGACLASAESV